jgi:outer membrane protein TolC
MVEIFKDPELNALEEELNINNQNIKQFYENYMEARALIREARSQYFPVVTTAPSYTRSRSPATLGAGTIGVQNTIYQLPVDITWAPDLWGSVRKTVQEFQYAAQLSAADLENERLLERRPDIAAAERAMAQANAQIGIAYTAFYPTLTLTAAGGVESSKLGSLFSWSSRAWAIGSLPHRYLKWWRPSSWLWPRRRLGPIGTPDPETG